MLINITNKKLFLCKTNFREWMGVDERFYKDFKTG